MRNLWAGHSSEEEDLPGTLKTLCSIPGTTKIRTGRVSRCRVPGLGTWERNPISFPCDLGQVTLLPCASTDTGNSNCTPAVGLLKGFHRCICTSIRTRPCTPLNKYKVIKMRKARCVLTSPRAMQVEAIKEGVRGKNRFR